jgi:protein TonB
MPILTFDSIPQAAARRTRRKAPRPDAPPAAAAIDADAPSVLAAPGRNRVAVVGAILALHVGAGLVLTITRKPAPTPQPEAVMLYVAPLRAEPPPPPPPPPPKVKLPPLQVVPAPPRIAVVAPPAVAAPVAASPVVAVAVQAPVAETVAAAPPPPPPPVVEKVTEPRGYAGYLSNPAPEYPVAAQKRGLEGQVLLKVHVLPSGKPDDVTVARSSGHAVLDDAALKAVMRWVFEPARRGQTAIEGWVQVPLNFRI